MQSLSSRLLWERDQQSGQTTVYLDGQFLAAGPETALRLALYRQQGLADIITQPKEATPWPRA